MRIKEKKAKKRVTVKPPLYDWVMRSERLPFFRTIQCPHCGTQVRYGKLLARLPVFTEHCAHCGASFSCGPGVRSLIFALLFLVFACLFVIAVMTIATDMVPVYIFTLILVLGAYFLWPLTLKVWKKKQK